MYQNSFGNYNATLYVRVNSIAAYDTAQYWQDFSDIQTSIVSTITILANDSAKGTTFGNGAYMPTGKTSD